MENEKLNMASLLGVSILLKQLLEQDYLTYDEAEAIMRKMVKDNAFSDTYASLLVRHIYGGKHFIRKANKDKIINQFTCCW